MSDDPGGDDASDGPPATEATFDDLAGVVDLFGALDRVELRRALAELAFKRGESVDEAALDDAIAEAIEGYYLVPVAADAVTVDGGRDGDSGTDGATGPSATAGDADEYLAAGPVAFPSLPSAAEDLPHILDVPERTVDRDALAERALSRFRAEAARAVDADERNRIASLLDVSYDIEAWAGVDVGEVRDRLDAALDRLESEDG